MNRRLFLSGLGAAGLGLVGASVWRIESNHVLRVADGPAYNPWVDWRDKGTNSPEHLVRAAILAASPHNTQPWRFHLSPGSIDVYADTSRNLGAMDPLLREMHIGIGCAVENLLLAAESAGYRWSFDQPQQTTYAALLPMARIVLKDGASRVPELYTAIPKRHTNRGPYKAGRDVEQEVIEELDGLKNSDFDLRVFWFRKPAEREAFGRLVVSATQAIIKDEDQSKSSARWMRTSWSEIQSFRDGLTYDAQGMSRAKAAVAKFLPPLGVKQGDGYWLWETRETHVPTAAAFGMIAVRNANDRQQRLEAGRLWQRMHLLATLRGAAIQPLNQPMERRDREMQLGLPPVYQRALTDPAAGRPVGRRNGVPAGISDDRGTAEPEAGSGRYHDLKLSKSCAAASGVEIFLSHKSPSGDMALQGERQ